MGIKKLVYRFRYCHIRVSYILFGVGYSLSIWVPRKKANNEKYLRKFIGMHGYATLNKVYVLTELKIKRVPIC